MMRRMRENTKWIMLATALAFVALMVFQWGMDITGRSSGTPGELGRVNGVPVMYEQYMSVYRNLYDQVSRSQDEPISSQQNREIEDQAWEELVNQILIQQELERRGIRVTDDEIRQAARFSPPPDLMSNPLFETDGQFDLQKYQQFLATAADPELLRQLEAYYRNVIPRNKLLRQVTTGIYPSDAELWQMYRDMNEQVRVRFVALDPMTRIPDSAVTITEAEVQRYYREHRDEFQVPARATVKYITLTKAPLADDTLAAYERARSIRREILEGADFGEVARRESADTASASKGGDLGTFGRGQMVPAFDSAAFRAPLNRVTEPVLSPFGLHLIEVLSRKGDSIHARHILVPIERTPDSELRLLTMADTVEALGENFTLDEVGEQLGLPVRTQELTDVFPFLAGAGQVGEGADWVFQEGFPGAVSPVFENRQAYYILEVVDRSPAGVQSLEEARPEIEQILRMEKKMTMAEEEGRAIAARAREAGSLEAAVAGTDLTVREVGPFTRGSYVPVLGATNRAVGVAFGLDEGEISDPVRTEGNVVVLQTVEHIPADSAAWEAQKAEQRGQLMVAIQQQRLQDWLEGLRESATVVDRRDQVLQPAAGLGAPAGLGFPGGSF